MLETITQTPLAAALFIFQLLAGYGAGLLGRCGSAAELKQNAQLTLSLAAISLLFIALAAVELIRSGFSAQQLDEGLLFILLLILPAAAMALTAIPRLARLASARSGGTAVFSRTRRRQAAEAWLVVPVQALTLGSGLHLLLLTSPSIMASSLLFPAALLMLPIAITLLAIRQQIRYKHVHRLGCALLLTRMKRIAPIALAAVVLPALLYSIRERQEKPITLPFALKQPIESSVQAFLPPVDAARWMELGPQVSGSAATAGIHIHP